MSDQRQMRLSLEESEITGCINCFASDEHLVVADALDVHRKYRHYLTSESTRHCPRTQFLSNSLAWFFEAFAWCFFD